MVDENQGALALDAALKKRKWTHEQAEIALGLTVKSGAITRFLNLKRLPSMRLAAKMQAVLGIPMILWRSPPARKAS